MSKEDRVRQMIADQLIVDEVEVTPNANLRDDLGADSLDVVELVMQCEVAFSISISDDEGEKWITVKDVLDCIAAK